jgi:hypothetical protein
MSDSDKAAQSHPVLAFRAEPSLLEWTDAQAALEGISRSDFARRALLRERQRQQTSENAT